MWHGELFSILQFAQEQSHFSSRLDTHWWCLDFAMQPSQRLTVHFEIQYMPDLAYRQATLQE
jgi:hypothetical protein